MIPLSRPSLGQAEKEAVLRVLDSGWLAQGQEVEALEREFGVWLDPCMPLFVVAVSSGTAALHLALLAAGTGPCTPVAAPSYTFVATANAALYCGARVALREIDARSYNLDPEKLGAVGAFDEPGLIVAVHQVGLACDLDRIHAAAPKAAIVEDAACAIGARYSNGARVGTRVASVAACFSLHGSKSIVAGEGGLVATRHRHIADHMRSLRQHGVNVSAEHRGNAETESYDRLGYNYRMTDLQAAIARVQIQRADAIVATRRERARRYTEALADVALPPLETPVGSFHAYQRYLLRVRDGECRERLVAALVGAGIACRRGIQCIHRQPYWRTRMGFTPFLPVTEEVAGTTVQLPLWADMSEENQARVIDVVRKALA